MSDLRVVGIDWAAQAVNRGKVRLRFDRAKGDTIVEDVIAGVTDDAVVAAMRHEGVSTVAVDIPFGWPARFAELASGWSFIAASDVAVPSRDDFSFRRTDLVVAKIKRPLSVSSDRIALATLPWVRVLQQHALHGHVEVFAERPATPRPSIIEVYPAATLATLVASDSLAIDRYKNDAGLRAAMIESLMRLFRVQPCSDELKRILVGKGKASHATDALVAALTALVYEGVLSCRP